jgi:hypothetical protein
MMIGLMLFVAAAILIGLLLVRLAVYALPAYCAFRVAQAVHASDAGLVAAIIAGALAAIATLALGQVLVALARSPAARIAVGLAFVLPAGLAGYHAIHGIAVKVMPVSLWQQLLPLIFAMAIAVMAWTRLGSGGRLTK